MAWTYNQILFYMVSVTPGPHLWFFKFKFILFIYKVVYSANTTLASIRALFNKQGDMYKNSNYNNERYGMG